MYVESNQILSSWKEIASFFGKGVRTVQRWERTLGLPIYRPEGASQNMVFARTEDLQRWLNRPKSFKPDESISKHQHTRERTRFLLDSLAANTARLHANEALFRETYAKLLERRQRKLERNGCSASSMAQ